jgi:hypothetical protein
LELITAGSDGVRVSWERARYPSPDDVVLVQRIFGPGFGERVEQLANRISAAPIAAALDLAIEGPSRQSTFALPSPGRAGIELFDIAGRLLLTRDLGWLAAGDHLLPALGRNQGAPGVFFVRVTLDGRPVGFNRTLIH